MRILALTIAILTFAIPAASAQELSAQPFQDVTQEIRNFRNFRALQVEDTLNMAAPTQSPLAQKQHQANQNARLAAATRTPTTRRQLEDAIAVDRLARDIKPSPVEDVYSSRIVQNLDQFGYDLFGVPNEETRAALLGNTPTTVNPSGAVQDDFILGSGDELEIIFTGQRRDRGTYTINNRGLLVIPDLPPIPASGRTIGQLRISVESAARNLHNTEAYVSLSSVRQINTLVIGHVGRPGRKNLTVFHTILDALMDSGGIQKTGSLRQIKLIRDGRSTMIDLYALLMHGQSAVDLRLRDGDRIIVPAIGPTVAIAGEAKRPGIYEILPTRRGMLHEPGKNSQSLTLNEMLELGGGPLSPGKNRFLKLAITNNGEETVTDIDDAFKPTFTDGSILMISKGSEKRAGTVELTGNTRRPGIHALSESKSLSALIPSETTLAKDTYPLIGVIERYDANHLTNTLIDFPLRLVLNGNFDQTLQDGDVIHLFSNAQIASLSLPPQPRLQPAAYGSNDDTTGNTTITDPVMTSFLRERSAFMRGAVRNTGAYPVATGITLDSLLAVSGGLTLEANTTNIEVTSSAFANNDVNKTTKTRQNINLKDTPANTVIIEPGASVRINQKFEKITDKSVIIMGEVTNPGRYDLLPGDKISDLLTRAGGLTPHAYPYGAIFSRESERRAEETRFRSQAFAIEQSIAAAIEQDDNKVGAGKIAEARALSAELRNARGAGRITIEASPETLALNPGLDLLLQSGDRLFIPKRDLTVRVHGEILSPASLQFRTGKSPKDYIAEAGGFTFNADKNRAFVLYPDGSAQPLQISAWNYKETLIPPGSTIVVPRDPKPFDFIQSAKDVSQILSNLAVTAIFIDDVIDEN